MCLDLSTADESMIQYENVDCLIRSCLHGWVRREALESQALEHSSVYGI